MVLGDYQEKRDTSANWTSNNPTLLAGVLGYDTTSKRWKLGDGSTAWNSLPFLNFPRVGTTTSSATPTINSDIYDMYGLTAQTADITSFTTNLSGTPANGQKLWIYIVGTAARAITWGASFEAGAAALPTTTVTTQRLDAGFVWNVATSKWRCMAAA